ncbi:hypothetical protein DYH53_15235 [Klebsiella pneumoniae subsp. pneumoniae]|nr:hypothetical protein AXK16_09770 [Klebsiella pneumoniae]MBA2121890.1 hypothetical protein [Klebsiella pneumoniae subsp. pneumoniae]ARS98985.1 hypothetical protein B8O09_07325 [Klebsiella pneumoniae]ASC25675.1 hypothetical protein AM386_29750 [Klebsiella pneumoniae]MVB25766.1 hypothetical protein [Klebsiella pneumoniae subsp. pneumoniae]
MPVLLIMLIIIILLQECLLPCIKLRFLTVGSVFLFKVLPQTLLIYMLRLYYLIIMIIIYISNSVKEINLWENFMFI